MAVPFRFRKARAEYLVECIRKGRPIAPEKPGGWSLLDNLQTAAALLFAAWSHGPDEFREVLNRLPTKLLNAEQREAAEEAFMDEIMAALQYQGMATMQVCDGEYEGPDIAVGVAQWQGPGVPVGIQLTAAEPD